MELIQVQNKFTPSLENQGFYVCKGWNERLATQLAYEQLHTNGSALRAQVEKLHDWYENNNVLAYSLGWRASLAAFAHFTLEDSPYTAAFDVTAHNPRVHEDVSLAFAHAVHYDFVVEHEQLGDISSTVEETDGEKMSLLQQVGYRRIAEFGQNVLLLRKGVGEW